MQPPDLDLAPSGDRRDDVERAGEDKEEADHSRQRQKRIARMDERDDAGGDEDDRQDTVEQLPPAAGEDRRHELEQPGRDCDDAEQDRDRVHRRVVEAQHDQRDDSPGDTEDQEEPPGWQQTPERALGRRGDHGHEAS